MPNHSRRDFLKACIASAGSVAVGGNAIFGSPQGRALDLLVVGDSLVWGQGLLEKDKFYTLTADWLRKNAFGRARTVDLKVKAHSAANLKLDPNIADKLKKGKIDETFPLAPEVNVGFPSTWTQIETAAKEYRDARNRSGADLIMLAGGLPDVSISKVLDPYGDDRELPPLIERHCRDDMLDILRHAARHHPNAAIIVLGYYPLISPKTSDNRLLSIWLETMNLPGAVKPVANNAFTRRLFFGRIKQKVLKRSRIWADTSNLALQLAVDRFNARFPEPRAVFVRSPITEATTFETPNTLVFKMVKNKASEDPLAAARTAVCKTELARLKKLANIENSVRRCEIAAVGHPNALGARAYFDEIRNTIALQNHIIRRLARVGQ